MTKRVIQLEVNEHRTKDRVTVTRETWGARLLPENGFKDVWLTNGDLVDIALMVLGRKELIKQLDLQIV